MRGSKRSLIKLYLKSYSMHILKIFSADAIMQFTDLSKEIGKIELYGHRQKKCCLNFHDAKLQIDRRVLIYVDYLLR